ncbi:MAG: DUF4271 domain-containing protein [Chitinophagaceae bacterium]|nr:DUF4271 domain-containing protein [Chitinophagaceae bacterium]
MQLLKIFFLMILANACYQSAVAQIDTGTVKQPESTRAVPVQPRITTDTLRTIPQAAPVKKRIADSLRPKKSADTVRVDSSAIRTARLLHDSLYRDSLKKVAAIRAYVPKDTSTYGRFRNDKFLGTDKPAIFMLADLHRRPDKDELFYLMAGVLFCLGFIKAGFPKYFRNLFMLFFQTSLRQKQTRDQLLQDNLASLLINLLFIASAGLYITLLIRYRHFTPTSFWVLALTSAAALILIYLGKYLFLLFAGWVFNSREAAGSYIFLVFLVNKVMGVLLVPFLLLLAFSGGEVLRLAVVISMALVGLLFVYRYFVSFNAIRSKLKVNVLHFFLYLCAVEILPLLLMYKLLINYFDGSI